MLSSTSFTEASFESILQHLQLTRYLTHQNGNRKTSAERTEGCSDASACSSSTLWKNKSKLFWMCIQCRRGQETRTFRQIILNSHFKLHLLAFLLPRQRIARAPPSGQARNRTKMAYNHLHINSMKRFFPWFLLWYKTFIWNTWTKCNFCRYQYDSPHLFSLLVQQT